MARTIEAFKLRTEIAIDNAKAAASLKATEKGVDSLGKRFTRLGPEIDRAMKGHEAGAKFGQQFSSSATALITGSFDSLGQTLGSIIGTAITPGIGTAIGGVLGSAADTAFAKISGPMMQTIAAGIELNKELERTTVEFTHFAGSEKEATKYLKELKEYAVKTGTDFNWVLNTSEQLFDLTDNLKLTNVILRASTEQAADFGGKAETIGKIANALGLIAEKGSLASRELQKLYKLGINATKELAEATGMSEKQIASLIKQDRIRGDVAARLISEGILRKKAGFAEKIADTTTYGAESRFKVQTSLLAARGTEKATQGIGDFYRAADKLLAGDKAEQFVAFIDQTTGSLINLVERGISAGVNVTKGLADGISSGDAFRAVGSATTSLGNFVESSLKSVFEIESPSERTAREIGVPMGEGIAQGVSRGFVSTFKGQTTDEIVAALESLLQDSRVKALLDTIRKAEGGDTNLIVGGKRFSDLSHHPNVVGMRTSKGPSTAAGSYQITGTNWRKLQPQLGLPDFSEHSQQLAALKLFIDSDHGAGLQALLSGDMGKVMNSVGKNWTSAPGSKIGGGGQRSTQQWMGYYNQALSANGKPITDADPLPVRFAGVFGGASGNGGTGAPDVMSGASLIFGKQTQNLKELTMVLDDADGATVDVKADMQSLITDAIVPTGAKLRQLLNSVEPTYKAIIPLIGAEKKHADTSIELTKKYQQAAREELIVGMSTLDQLSGAIGQISGLLPQQEVGKKRGLFSKILGIAAPFLSFIPGVGPILSQIAGMGSAAAGGNWGGVATGLAGGLAPGGVFRGSGRGSSGSSGTEGKRAAGGPGMRGRVYWTGEHGPEPFLAPSNGAFLSHGDAMSAMGGGGDPGMTAMLERLHGVLARLEGVRPHDVVRMGARGLIDAYDSDAGLIRLSGQRHRLA